MNTVSLKTLGDWQQKLKVPLQDVLAVSMDVCGRTGVEACKHALILMAQSASKITPLSQKKRPVEHDSLLGDFVRKWKNGKDTRLFKFNFSLQEQAAYSASQMATWGHIHKRGILDGTWEQAQNIANRGLAKRSWIWGLKRFGKAYGKPIPGVARTLTIISEKACGFILQNSLKYLSKIMPAGWQSDVTERAGNKIMKQAAMKIERQWKSEMNRSHRGGAMVGKALAQYFLGAA